MKLRLATNAVRLRVLRSELAALTAGNTLRECVRLAPGPSGSITYALSVAQFDESQNLEILCTNGNVCVRVSHEAFAQWRRPEEVGIYARLETGGDEPLQVIIEKDFACLDRSDQSNQDTFEHPKEGALC